MRITEVFGGSHARGVKFYLIIPYSSVGSSTKLLILGSWVQIPLRKLNERFSIGAVFLYSARGIENWFDSDRDKDERKS